MLLLALGRSTRHAFAQTYFGAEDPNGYRAYVVLAGLLLALAAVVVVPQLYWREPRLDVALLAQLALALLAGVAAFGWEGVAGPAPPRLPLAPLSPKLCAWRPRPRSSLSAASSRR